MTTKHRQLVTQMYADVITVDPYALRFQASNTDKNGIDRLGAALPEQKKEAKDKRKAAQRQSNKEVLAAWLFFAVVFAAFMLGRLSLGHNIIADSQAILEFMAGLMR